MHKSIGILGGMSPESTIEYYKYITRTYTERFGDFGYPEIVIFSVSFQPYDDWPAEGRWDLVAQGLSDAAKTLEAAGADFIIIATNTMHIVFDQVQASVDVPMISLLNAVGDTIRARDFRTVGLLGTKYTMEKGFYQEAMAKKGLEVLTPGEEDRRSVNKVIYEELTVGRLEDKSRQGYIEIIEKLAGRGAQGVILGCTEIPLLIQQKDIEMPVFDTTKIHAEAALEFALSRTD